MKPPHGGRPGGGRPPHRSGARQGGWPGSPGHHQGQGEQQRNAGRQHQPARPQDQGGRQWQSNQGKTHGPGQPSGNRAQHEAHSRPQSGYQHGPWRDRPAPQQAPRGAEAPRGTIWLYGRHAVAAALANPARRLRRLMLTEEADAALAQRLPKPWAIPHETVERGRLDQLLGRDIVHQGVALLVDPLPTPGLAQVLERSGPLLVLDQVTDPRNVGAILRSAAAFGAAGVITQDRNAPEETGTLARAASGALESMPLLRAVNIARTLIALKAASIWVVGLDTAAPVRLSGPALNGRRVALVLGAEDEGLRRLTRETCDELASLAMPGGLDSLNVSVAAAVSLYEITRQNA